MKRIFFIVACLISHPGDVVAEGSDIESQIDLARELRLNGDTAAAITILSKVVAEVPDSFRAQYNLGLAMALGGQEERALDHLYRAARLFSSDGNRDATIFNSYGWQLLRTGRIELAIVQFELGLANFELLSKRSQSRLLNNYGLALMQANRYSDAELVLRRAASEYENPLAQSNLQVVQTLQQGSMVWTVVLGADRTVQDASYEIARAKKAGVPNPQIVLNGEMYRTVSRNLSREAAEEVLAAAREFRPDAYLVRSQSWCVDPQEAGAFLRCGHN